MVTSYLESDNIITNDGSNFYLVGSNKFHIKYDASNQAILEKENMSVTAIVLNLYVNDLDDTIVGINLGKESFEKYKWTKEKEKKGKVEGKVALIMGQPGDSNAKAMSSGALEIIEKNQYFMLIRQYQDLITFWSNIFHT